MRHFPRFLLIILIVCIAVSAAQSQHVLPDEKRVVFAVDELPIEDALKKLTEVSGVNIAFQNELLPKDAKVTVIARQKSVGQILDYLLNDLDLSYKIVGNQLVLVQDIPPIEILDYITISGYVYDKQSGESLPYANVYTHDTKYGTVANDYGFYKLVVPRGEMHIYYSYTAYKLDVRDFESQIVDTIVNVYLTSNTYLNEVLIVDDKITAEPTPATKVEVPVRQISAMVPLGGEPDILQFVKQSPGVSFGSDGLGGFSVRGGNVEHNLIQLDGVPLYEINHALGLFSVFNNYAVKSSVLYKSGLPTKYGGRLSSVLDIRTKEGNLKKTRGEIGLGTLAVKGTIEGPIAKDKSSYILSLRRTYIDPFIKTFSNSVNQATNSDGSRLYNFYDGFGKMRFELSPKSKLFITVFSGGDTFNSDITRESEEANDVLLRTNRQFIWENRNTLFSSRFNKQTKKNAFYNITAFYTNYRLTAYERFSLHREEQQISKLTDFDGQIFESRIGNLGAKFDYDIILRSGNQLKYGLNYTSHNFSPGSVYASIDKPLSEVSSDLPNIGDFRVGLENIKLLANELRGYIEYDFKFGTNHCLSLGYNQVFYRTVRSSPKIYIAPEPRLNLLFAFPAIEVRASFNRLTQFSHRLTTSTLGWPLDVWVPSTRFIKPQSVWNASLGTLIRLSKSSSIGVDIYTKYFDNLISYNAGGDLNIGIDTNWEFKVPEGTGNARGIEIWYAKEVGKLLLNANYTLAYSSRTFTDINLGSSYRYRYDNRHFIKLNALYRLNNNIELACNWQYGSGNPISIPSFVTIEDGKLVLKYDEVNGKQLEPMHRLDIGVNFYNKLEWGRLKTSFGLYNAYNRRNTYFIDVIPQESGKLRKFSVLPILPSLSLSLHF